MKRYDTTKQWYAIHTYSGYEEKVAESIRQRAAFLSMPWASGFFRLKTGAKTRPRWGQCCPCGGGESAGKGNKVSALSLSRPAAFLRDPLSSRVGSTRTDGQGLLESKRNGIDRASQAIGVPYP